MAQYQVDTTREGAGRLVEYADSVMIAANGSTWPAAAGPGIRDLISEREGLSAPFPALSYPRWLWVSWSCLSRHRTSFSRKRDLPSRAACRPPPSPSYPALCIRGGSNPVREKGIHLIQAFFCKVTIFISLSPCLR